MANGYPRFPTIHRDTIVFVCEDDLWTVPAAGGHAARLTAGVAAASHPRVSPDGTLIAYTGREEGPAEVHVVPMGGGESRRLTFEGGYSLGVTAWRGDSVVYATAAQSPTRGETRLRTIDAINGADSAELPYGRGSELADGPDGVSVIARGGFRDAAGWKRYRGGTAGHLWIRDGGSAGDFRRLREPNGNLANPNIIGDRIYFLSDHEGYGNVYSIDFAGGDLRRHTDHGDFYARSLSGDGERLVYHCGGDVYLLDPAEDGPRKLEIAVGVTRTQRARRFVDTGEYLHSAHLSDDGSSLAITSRGKPFTFGNWEGPVVQHGATDGVRYRDLAWLPGGERLVAIAADDGPREVLVTLPLGAAEPDRRLDLDLGRVMELAVAPEGATVALVNHRNQLLVVDLDAEEPVAKVLDTSAYGQMSDPVFSPDGGWIAYSCPLQASQEDAASRTGIKLVELATGTVRMAAERVLRDEGPSFDPDGKYLYFIGHREFNPVYDELHFDLNFPTGARPYAIALRSDVAAPFVPTAKPLTEEEDKDKDKTAEGDGEGEQEEKPVARIDFDGITHRIVPLPLPDGRYDKVVGVSGKVLVLSRPVEGTRPSGDGSDDPVGALDSVDLASGKVERVADGVSDIELGPDGKTLLYRSGDRLRVIKAGEKAPDESGTTRDSGWVDLGRVKVSVRPETEWPQMFREAWRLMAEHFWTEDMSGVDWNGVYERYAPLVDRISTRGELSDLFWEMNGELGTSHAYEALGDYRAGPYYGQGYLGAEFALGDDGYTIARILEGDPWLPEATSSFNRPGVDVREGDRLLAVNGQAVGEGATPGQRLVNQAGQEVRLTVARGDEEPRTVTVKALDSEAAIRYRDWVEDNRRKVHEATDGQVGYIHVPDMGPHGFAEFHRAYLNEFDRNGLIVDVRYNGGGHVSGLLIEKLARRRLGYDHSRWNMPMSYPAESPRGPLVAIANELAGSDGDIFSQAFKQLQLGPLVGKRTWGGVVGYTDRAGLVDNTFLSQPEFAFHFDATGWGVENYGVDPDVEVEMAPQDHAAGRDPQLETAIELALVEIQKRPPHTFTPADRPRLTAPVLPPRAG
ncbi:S41 family peptidase [Phytomonospora endophytica]|uniref:Tricorn protease homolog n=1 Tax=Phytomonospora endophytica TaxID=714109 RepID=A0A841FF18_9ACTN|nr:S41 family peptidase [Phytomonospora endophytica]MBB6032438.1 tricorn protease [Phytomonospora endophytica]GIG66415.1 tricorn protease [Phytomonospora endophytica]